VELVAYTLFTDGMMRAVYEDDRGRRMLRSRRVVISAGRMHVADHC
jgi:hypothetical protein